MEKRIISNKTIRVIEMDKINQQAETLSGLSHVCAMYLGFTNENEFLQRALECLMNKAYEHQDYCHSLLKKIEK